jgi:Flp pilus assembly protein TadD
MDEHNRLFLEAVDLIQPELRTSVNPSPPLSAETVPRLEHAIALLDRVVEMNPQNWSAFWMRGKAQQALEDHAAALASFVRALELHPIPDCAREAGIAAAEMGDHALSVGLTRMALKMAPGEPGLLANLGLALLFDNRPAEARPALVEALAGCPSDNVTRALLQATDDVLAGRRSCPHSVRELSADELD